MQCTVLHVLTEVKVQLLSNIKWRNSSNGIRGGIDKQFDNLNDIFLTFLHTDNFQSLELHEYEFEHKNTLETKCTGSDKISLSGWYFNFLCWQNQDMLLLKIMPTLSLKMKIQELSCPATMYILYTCVKN